MNYRDTHYVVLYFHPKDAAPGCTHEAIAFRHLPQPFLLAGAAILALCSDDLPSHAKLAAQYNLTSHLLSDVLAG